MEVFVSYAKMIGGGMSILLGAAGCAKAAEEQSSIGKVGSMIVGIAGIVGGASVIIDDMINNIDWTD